MQIAACHYCVAALQQLIAGGTALPKALLEALRVVVAAVIFARAVAAGDGEVASLTLEASMVQ